MKNTKKSKYYKSKKINQNKKMTTQKKKKRSKKKNNKAGVLTLIEQDQLLAFIRYTYFQITGHKYKMVIKATEFQIGCEYSGTL